jgi:hypothetical protein
MLADCIVTTCRARGHPPSPRHAGLRRIPPHRASAAVRHDGVSRWPRLPVACSGRASCRRWSQRSWRGRVCGWRPWADGSKFRWYELGLVDSQGANYPSIDMVHKHNARTPRSAAWPRPAQTDSGTEGENDRGATYRSVGCPRSSRSGRLAGGRLGKAAAAG